MTTDKRHLALADRLRALREHAGYRTGKDFAERIGWVASKVSRIENGRTLPSDKDITTWMTTVGASNDDALAVRDEVRELRLARDRWKQQLRQGHAGRQRNTAADEHDASRIVMVEFFLIPGLVQTADFMRAVFALAADMHGTPPDTDAAVLERVRRQEVLYDPDKTVEILLSEAALRYPIGSPDMMRVQLDRLANLAGLAHVRLGIIPLGTVLPTITMHGYTILDDTVIIEVNHTEITATEPEDVELYNHITARLWEVAAEGDEARALLRDVLDHQPAAS